MNRALRLSLLSVLALTMHPATAGSNAHGYAKHGYRGNAHARTHSPFSRLPAAMPRQQPCATNNLGGADVRDCSAPAAAKPPTEITDAMNRGNVR
jgi:hypothetical protein